MSPKGNLKDARLDSAGTAHAAINTAYAVMAAASSADPWAPLPTAICTVGAATGDVAKRALTENSLLARFAEYERVEADAQREPLAGSLTSLSVAAPGGDGGGLRMYSGVLIPAGGCTFDEVRDAALRD